MIKKVFTILTPVAGVVESLSMVDQVVVYNQEIFIEQGTGGMVLAVQQNQQGKDKIKSCEEQNETKRLPVLWL